MLINFSEVELLCGEGAEREAVSAGEATGFRGAQAPSHSATTKKKQDQSSELVRLASPNGPRGKHITGKQSALELGAPEPKKESAMVVVAAGVAVVAQSGAVVGKGGCGVVGGGGGFGLPAQKGENGLRTHTSKRGSKLLLPMSNESCIDELP